MIGPVAASVAALAGAAFCAQDGFDETSFFQDSLPAKASVAVPGNDTAGSIWSGAKTSFSGSTVVVGQMSLRKGGIDTTGGGGAQIVADGTVDARLATGSRANTTVEIVHDASRDTTLFHVREMFVDGNIGDVVRLRAGKQVLQWGRGILWTPTDLVNVEGRTLVPRAGAREGATGLRVQVPVGRSANIYGFFPMDRVDAFDSLSAAWRAEAAVGPMELAVSGHHRKGSPLALGLDGSSGLLGWDLQAGATWFDGDPAPRPVVTDGKLGLASDPSRSQVKAGGGIGRGFKLLGDPDRLRVDLEGFWQSDALGRDLLSDSRKYAWSDPTPLPASVPSELASLLRPRVSDRFTYLVAHGLYVPNQLESTYLASMVSVQKFVVQDLVLTLQAMGSLEDGSGVATAALSWTTFRGFTAGLTNYWFWGGDRTELMLSGRGYAVEGRMGISY